MRCYQTDSKYRGEAPMLTAGGGGGKRRSQLGGQGRVPQVRGPPGGFYGMPQMKFLKI